MTRNPGATGTDKWQAAGQPDVDVVSTQTYITGTDRARVVSELADKWCRTKPSKPARWVARSVRVGSLRALALLAYGDDCCARLPGC